MQGDIFLAGDTITNSEIDSLAEWLKTYPRLTKGNLTEQFEEGWSTKLGTRYSVYVNSGSSANLLMLYALMESGRISPGDSVVVPAISWATDLAPVIQLGLNPILCDINFKDLSVDLHELRALIKEHSPKILLLVSVLGLVPDMNSITSICEDNDVILLEDVCESLGSKYQDINLGTYGLMSSFSLYIGHHLSTIEGGMICTKDRDMYYLLKSLRSHGWGREYPKETQRKLQEKYNISTFNAMFSFYNAGFNLRATDLQAFIGISQLKKWDSVCEARKKNFDLYNSFISDVVWKPSVDRDCFVSNFAYPIITKQRDKISEKLKRNKIECRPLISGSMLRQPMYRKNFNVDQRLPVADSVHNHGMYVPNHPGLSTDDIRRISAIVNEEMVDGI